MTRPSLEPEAVIYARLKEAAKAGKPCPTNVDLAMAVGLKSPSGAAAIVKRLEERGLIEVRRYVHSRVVTIDGLSTAAPVGGAPHWRKRSGRPREKKAQRPAVRKVYSRKPNPSAGVRPIFGDIGPRPKTCQWIEGEPSANAPRCGAPVAGPHTSYCEAHHRRVWKPRPVIHRDRTP